MRQTLKFEYEEFWNSYERNDRPDTPILENDGWTSAFDLEDPAPPWVRAISRRDPFPPCKALLSWPSNYPVGELADLTDKESLETEVDRFVYSDPEMEGWSDFIGFVSEPTDGPSWLPEKGVTCAPRSAFREPWFVNPDPDKPRAERQRRRTEIEWF